MWTYFKFSTKSDIPRHTESVIFQYGSAETVRNGETARGLEPVVQKPINANPPISEI